MSAPETSAAASTSAPQPPVVHTAGSGSSILVNTCQRGNPVLDHIRSVAKEWADIVPDFQIGRTACALFLSLKYHRLHPEYVHGRIDKLAHMYDIRVLLVQCDITEHQEPLREITKLGLYKRLTVIVAWSPEECAMYLSAFKVYEHKPPDAIRERVEKDHMSVMRAALTNIKKVNKTDVVTLKTTFGSFAGMSRATEEDLVKCPGVGQKKARRIREAFNQPFYNRPPNAAAPTHQPLNPARVHQGTSGTSVPTQGDVGAVASSSTSSGNRPVRQPSPDWVFDSDEDDDEDEDAMDLDDPKATKNANNDAPLNPRRAGAIEDDVPLNPRRRPRTESPPWDLGLDLNSDDDAPAEPAAKRLKPSTILDDAGSDDSDD